ncbi:hypothetical protein [Sphingomonas antarctica]|uniref:hypothetical protein n=1 Tax=Sphingomonas antarctica TaxID=2040274 RepID=UPI0039EB8BCF
MGQLLAALHDTPIESQAAQSVSAVQFVARGDPSGGDDVRPVLLSLRNVEDLLFERGVDV